MKTFGSELSRRARKVATGAKWLPAKCNLATIPPPFAFLLLTPYYWYRSVYRKGTRLKALWKWKEGQERPWNTILILKDKSILEKVSFPTLNFFACTQPHGSENQRRAFSEKAGQLWSPFFALLCQIFSVQSRAFKVSLMRFWKFMVGTALHCWSKILIFQRSNQNQSRWWYSFRHIIERVVGKQTLTSRTR